MDIDRIREFIGLSKTCSPTQAARDFSITPAVLMKHIESLERELGTPLTIKNQFGVSLTQAGLRFSEDARAIVDEYDSAIDRIQRRKSDTDTTMVLGYLAAASRQILPAAVRAFSDRHPNVTLEFLSLEIDEIFEAICSRRIDAGITSTFGGDPLDPQRFSWRKLYSDRFALLVREDHPFAKRDCVSVHDLVNETILLTVPEFMGNDPRIVSLLEPIADSVDLCESAYDLDAALTLIRSGNHLALSLEHLGSVLGSGFSFIPIAEAKTIALEIGMLWQKNEASPLITELANDLRVQAESRTA